MKFARTDVPREQFIGPMTALILMHKNRAALQTAFPALNVFTNDNALTANIFSILFDPIKASFRADLVAAMTAIDANEGVLLNTAFTTSENFSSVNKTRSIDFINHLIQLDMDFLGKMMPFIKALPAEYDVLQAYIVDSATISAFSFINPVERPKTVDLLAMGIFASEEKLNEFASIYGSAYGYNSYYATHQQYYGYGDQGYQDYYQTQEPLILKDNTNTTLQITGIVGWQYDSHIKSLNDNNLELMNKKIQYIVEELKSGNLTNNSIILENTFYVS